MFKNANSRPGIASVLVVLALFGCDDSLSPEGSAPVTLSVAVDQSAAAGVSGFETDGLAADISQDDGEHTLVLSRVALVLQEVELERLSAEDCPDGVPDDDSCEEFEAGPFLLELPLDGSVTTMVSVDADPDIYDEVEFEIHKLVDAAKSNQNLDNADQPIVLYCGTGGRSALAAQCLEAMGYKKVSSMSGGLVAWAAAHLPLDFPV